MNKKVKKPLSNRSARARRKGPAFSLLMEKFRDQTSVFAPPLTTEEAHDALFHPQEIAGALDTLVWKFKEVARSLISGSLISYQAAFELQSWMWEVESQIVDHFPWHLEEGMRSLNSAALMVAALDDPDAKIRQAGVRALVEHEHKQGVGALQERLREEDGLVLKASFMAALYHFGLAAYLEPFFELVETADRETAEKILGFVPDLMSTKQNIPELRQRLALATQKRADLKDFVDDPIMLDLDNLEKEAEFETSTEK